MADSLREDAVFRKLEAEHCNWLSGFDPQYLRNWKKVLNNNEEAAMAEARMRQILESYGVTVEPNERLTGNGQSPDFRCFAGLNKFYVEITCIPIETATAKTGFPVKPQDGELYWVRPLTDAVSAKCPRKASQCANLDAPALLAVGTFHTYAGMDFDDKSIFSWFHNSATFFRRDKVDNTRFTRSSISGLMRCGLGSKSSRIRGILHPNPARPFDPTILPQIEFGQVVVDRASGQLRVAWPEEDKCVT